MHARRMVLVSLASLLGLLACGAPTPDAGEENSAVTATAARHAAAAPAVRLRAPTLQLEAPAPLEWRGCPKGIQPCSAQQVGQPCDPNNLGVLCSAQAN